MIILPLILPTGFGTCTFPTFSVKPPFLQPGNIFVANESLAGATTLLASNENTEITQGGGTPVQKNVSGQVTATTMYSVDRSRALEMTAVEAEKVCLDLLQLPECHALANATVYLEACVHNMMTTSDVRNFEASRMAFREACQARATSMLTLGNEFDKNVVAKVTTEDACQDDCHGRGLYVAGSCVCSSGFTGTACAVDLSQFTGSRIPMMSSIL
jgi:hypothetical protein